MIIGYKAFNKDLTSDLGMKFNIGKEYVCEGPIVVRKNGFHCCEKLINVFMYYPFNVNRTRVFEVELLGDVVYGKGLFDRIVTNKIVLKNEININTLKINIFSKMIINSIFFLGRLKKYLERQFNV